MNVNQGNTQKARTVTAWSVGKAIMIKKKVTISFHCV